MEKQKLTVLKIENLRPFPGNPFHLVEDEQLMELSESIKEFGMAAPILTRPAEDGDGYEVIAGQRRVRASELAGIESVPAFVLPIDRDRAIITLVDSNIQRESVLPSERAFAYKMKLDAMKRQGYRTDLTLSQVGTKSRTDEIVAKGFGVSKSTVQRFIRLTELIPPILQMVDEGRIALTPGAELSFLAQKEQENLLTTMESEDATPSLAQAQRMKKLSQAGQLDMDTIFAIMTEEKANQKETVKIGMDKLRKYFPRGTTPQQMEEIIIRLLERELRRKRNRDSR
ncbi:MAG: ParB/RepB/Spo0J family partition protein [Dysosmobacter sp.]|nr:ParB/RepB/Spo0J family partition protein [Dysosmobacter sp.]